MSTWKLQDAKAQLSHLVDLAMEGYPQHISRRGKEAVVLMRISDFEAVTQPKESLVEFFACSPHRDIEIDIERRSDTGREITL